MKCPKCGKEITRTFRGIDEITHLCLECGWTDDKHKVSPDNPYHDFAKEMRLLDEALKDEGFSPMSRYSILGGAADQVVRFMKKG